MKPLKQPSVLPSPRLSGQSTGKMPQFPLISTPHLNRAQLGYETMKREDGRGEWAWKSVLQPWYPPVGQRSRYRLSFRFCCSWNLLIIENQCSYSRILGLKIRRRVERSQSQTTSRSILFLKPVFKSCPTTTKRVGFSLILKSVYILSNKHSLLLNPKRGYGIYVKVCIIAPVWLITAWSCEKESGWKRTRPRATAWRCDGCLLEISTIFARPVAPSMCVNPLVLCAGHA